MFFARIITMVLLLGVLNACLSSGPPASAGINPAPCKEGGSELVQVKTVRASSGKLSIDMIMKLPCSTNNIDGAQQVYSMAFYDANKLVIPSDLTNINLGQALSPSLLGACRSQADLLPKIRADHNQYVLAQGASVSFSIGVKTLNSLHPVYLKYNIDNGVGTGDNCKLSGSETSPFIIDPTTKSPVYSNGQPIFGNDSDVATLVGLSYLMFSDLVGSGAPIYTYAILLNGDGKGVQGTTVNGGTEFQFDVYLKPGTYDIVFSQVKSPAAASTGNYSLQNVKVFSAGDNFDSTSLGFFDYQTVCNKSIETCAKRYLVL